jgi:hypothetical protein
VRHLGCIDLDNWLSGIVASSPLSAIRCACGWPQSDVKLPQLGAAGVETRIPRLLAWGVSIEYRASLASAWARRSVRTRRCHRARARRAVLEQSLALPAHRSIRDHDDFGCSLMIFSSLPSTTRLMLSNYSLHFRKRNTITQSLPSKPTSPSRFLEADRSCVISTGQIVCQRRAHAEKLRSPEIGAKIQSKPRGVLVLCKST